MKKAIYRIFLVATLMALASVFLIIIGVLPAPNILKKQEEDSLKQAVQIIKDKKVNLLIYGGDIPFEDQNLMRKIEKIDDSTLEVEDTSPYTFLVINDLDGEVTLSPEIIQLIRDYVYNKGYTVMYFGEKYLSAWDENQFITNVDGSKSVVHQNESGSVIRVVGNWGKQEQEIAKEYPYFQSQAIIY